MRATVFHGTRDVRVETVADPKIVHAGDAVVRITHACICGSDLWFYRGESKMWTPGDRTGHEWMGIVEDVGADVRTIRRGDRVLAPFSFSDGSCEYCRKKLQTSCVDGGFWGGENDGGQGEAVRAPHADATLVQVPREVANDERILTAILPLTDVMGTGHHAAISAGVRPGGTAVVIGDGAVGLCAVLAAKRLGAERIFALGRHVGRLEIARRFGATETIESRGDDVVQRIVEATAGGAESVLECVGTKSSMAQACAVARPGGRIGYVGVPYGAPEGLDLRRMFSENISLAGGVAPVRAYLSELLADVLAGKIDPSAVLDSSVDLDGVPDGYRAMDERRAIKVMMRNAA
jgi:threonine dehydrogenase-like Zn-dependent dehydrogenase